MDEKTLRKAALEAVQKYYEGVHRQQQQTPFTPGVSPLPYAGRVFDHEEMLSLTEATLDFWLTSGRFTDLFEKNFGEFLGVKHVSLVNSGSSANLLALSALTSSLLGERRIQKGDEVITVAAAFPTTVAPIIQNGAVPVFVDIRVEDGTYNIDASQLENALSPKTKAVFVAHTLGNPFDLDAVHSFCQRHGLWLIEDNCDALGAKYNGRFTGTFGHLATSSFYPPHHMTLGEGGAVYTNDKILERSIVSFRDWGRDCWCPSGKDNSCGKRFGWSLGSLPEGYDHKYIFRHLGYNLKATDLQASIGVAQLKKLPQFVQARKKNWSQLREYVADLSDRVILPEATVNAEPSWFGFALTLRDTKPASRARIVRALEEKKIQTRMLFSGNLLRHPVFEDLKQSGVPFRSVGLLEQTDRVMNQTFWVGVYPGLTSEKIDYMGSALRTTLKSN